MVFCDLCGHCDCPEIGITPEQAKEWKINEIIYNKHVGKWGKFQDQKEKDEIKEELITRSLFICRCCFINFNNLNPKFYPEGFYLPYVYGQILEGNDGNKYIHVKGKPCIEFEMKYLYQINNTNIYLVWDDPILEVQERLIKTYKTRLV